MQPRRFLATVLFTDIVGSTERAAELGDRAWRDLLAKHHVLVRRELQRFGGREIGTAGEEYRSAREEYELVLAAWQNADPELQPQVEEARKAVARLRSVIRE